MYQIVIPETLYKRLQKNAVPFVDKDPVSVIERLTDFYEAHYTNSNREAETAVGAESLTEQVASPRRFAATSPPPLFHTTVRGEFGSEHFSNWNELLRIAHIEAFAKAGSFDGLRRVTRAQIVPGIRSDKGFHHIPQIELSLQNVDADHAWQHAFRLAQYLALPIKAVVEWRHNDKAAYPGERAIIEWYPAAK
jgi:hypothetical protein